MSRSTTGRLLATNFHSFTRPRAAAQAAPQWLRPFSQSASKRADEPFPPRTTLAQGGSRLAQPQRGASSTMQDLINITMASTSGSPRSLEEMVQKLDMPEEDGDDNSGISQYIEPYHFHIYSHRHNTHVTVTRPNRDAILSLSCGNLGFKKAQRKSYDAAYQLGTYVVERLQQMGYDRRIRQMEVVLRGFGAGREAVTKVLMGTQARNLRNSVIRVSDNTRLKFGGTRSKKPRRLG